MEFPPQRKRTSSGLNLVVTNSGSGGGGGGRSRESSSTTSNHHHHHQQQQHAYHNFNHSPNNKKQKKRTIQRMTLSPNASRTGTLGGGFRRSGSTGSSTRSSSPGIGRSGAPSMDDHHPYHAGTQHQQQYGGRGGGVPYSSSMWRPFDRMHQLDDAGGGGSHSSWNRYFQRLQAFYNKYGHSAVPVGWALDPELGDWACIQRQYFREIRTGYRLSSKNSKVDETRWRQLQSVQFPLDYEQFHWTKRYNELQEALDGEVVLDKNNNFGSTTENGTGDNSGDETGEKSNNGKGRTASGRTSHGGEHGSSGQGKPKRKKLNPTLQTWLKNEQEKSLNVWSACSDHHPNNTDSKRIEKLERLGVKFLDHKDD